MTTDGTFTVFIWPNTENEKTPNIRIARNVLFFINVEFFMGGILRLVISVFIYKDNIKKQFRFRRHKKEATLLGRPLPEN